MLGIGLFLRKFYAKMCVPTVRLIIKCVSCSMDKKRVINVRYGPCLRWYV